MIKKIYILPLFISAVCVALAAAVLIKADILFHTDIARDFLLFEDVATNNPLTLIGARSGGIGGVFHGPLWLYLNMPAYLLTNGNPTLIGWFWFLLVLLAGLAVYWVGRKMFSPHIGLWATALYASCAINYAPVMFNPFGAVLLSPLFFYFLCRYLSRTRIFDLLATLFVLGCIIQFQIAFGGPILVITALMVLYSVFRSKKYTHFFGFLILLIPLSSYLLFELRHDFLQTRAVMGYIANSDRGKNFIWSLFFNRRLNGFLGEGIGVYLIPQLNIIIAALAVYIGWKVYPRLSKKDKLPYRTFAILYGGYWLLTLLFKGDILGYYTWQFLPMSLLLIASLTKHIPRLAYLLIASVIIINIGFSARNVWKLTPGPQNQGSWQFYKVRAQKIFTDAPSQFGYFIFTPDQFGYSERYALHYLQGQYPHKVGEENVKKQTVYLLVAPPPDDRPFFNHTWWQAERVKITKKPVQTWNDGYNFKTERYQLTNKEQQVQPDSSLINSLIFR
ncbi:hypothetical protein COU89_01200 [Candidatus Roizmanbacteria bacterium CG10_big_fil_rev_8_21_14_0_10_45_7]|uniref:Glycosyltransferase RgtA/B/C/D-like domain-containing protein n=1 Tax=Candidatus Roizmanbacteria bacterium CG10_big_fil_rev_8_21_14_0_10_45_7 TaxID=1974854 RepID=A0A2M8KV75_9BACT|nr:MAG: hypothetical protein COU89_01200 [Candidatus Roizmanbacteria bacterium CG10_big_fil_rev_8_21_14_0_10_45_7]